MPEWMRIALPTMISISRQRTLLRGQWDYPKARRNLSRGSIGCARLPIRARGISCVGWRAFVAREYW